MKNTMDFKEGEIVSIRAIGNKPMSMVTNLFFKEQGYTSIELIRCGKNILDLHNKLSDINGIKVVENIDGTFTFNGVPQKDYAAFTAIEFPTKNTTYTISQINYAEAWNKGIALTEQNLFDDGTFKNYFTALKSETFTRTSSGRWIAIIGNEERKGSPLFVNYTNGYQMEVGSRATPYEKYKGDTYSVAFPQKIYKGSYNWTTGELDGFSDVELKTPYKVKLNSQKINSFSGTNNIWSSEGNTKVGYYSLDDKVVICAIISNGILKMPTDKRYVVLGTNNFVEFQFDFVENQDMKNVIIEFEKDGIKNEGVLDKDNRIKLPQGITDGDLFIRIKDKATSKYLSKNKLKVIIDKNIYKIV